jgi:hypothetical protein
MPNRSATPHLNDIIEAIERVCQAIGDMPLAHRARDGRKQPGRPPGSGKGQPLKGAQKP